MWNFKFNYLLNWINGLLTAHTFFSGTSKQVWDWVAILQEPNLVLISTSHNLFIFKTIKETFCRVLECLNLYQHSENSWIHINSTRSYMGLTTYITSPIWEAWEFILYFTSLRLKREIIYLFISRRFLRLQDFWCPWKKIDKEKLINEYFLYLHSAFKEFTS